MSVSDLPNAVTTPDSATYLQLSFLGHTPRLWTVPIIYNIAGSVTGRIVLQSVIGTACWVALVVEVGRAIRLRGIAAVAQLVLLLVALSDPVLQWNRALLSESTAISLTALFFAAALAFARRRDATALVWLLVVAVFWSFTHQSQAVVVGLLALPFAILASRRQAVRRLALVGCAGTLAIGIWATITSLQGGSTIVREVNIAGVLQFRSVTNPDEMLYFAQQGMPHSTALQFPPPLAASGVPVDVSQFGDPYATQKVLSDPVLAHWIVQSGQSALFDYLVTHPWSTVSAPLAAIPEVMTMNPDYAPGPGLPSWASTIVYGNFPVLGTAFTGGGAGSSADPAYLDVLLALAAVVFIGAALRRRMTAPVWVSAIALAFMAVWAIETWSLCGTELPRIIIPSAILIHLALVVLVASGIDALVSAPTTANPGAHFGQRGGTRSVLARIRRGASRPVPPPPAGAA